MAMFSSEKCRDRAAECLQWAESAPSSRVRDILLDVARTWTRRRMPRREAGAGRWRVILPRLSRSPAQFFHHSRHFSLALSRAGGRSFSLTAGFFLRSAC